MSGGEGGLRRLFGRSAAHDRFHDSSSRPDLAAANLNEPSTLREELESKGEEARGPWAVIDRFLVSDRMDFAVIAAVVVYVVLGPFQHFPPAGWVDSGIYIGYFRNFGWMTEQYGATYFANRWPYLFPGWLVYRLFPYWAANLVLTGVWLTALLVALRSLLRFSLPAWARKWTLVLFGCSPLAAAMVTRAYPDGAVAAIGLFGLALIWRGMVSDRRVGPTSLAGAALVILAFLTHPGSLYMTAPIGLAMLLTVRPKNMGAWFLKAVLWGGAGVLVTMLVYLGVAYKITGIKNLPELMYAACCQNNSGADYRWNISLWIFSSTRIHFVMLLLAAGLLTLASDLRDAPDRLRRLLVCGVISTSVAAALLVFSDTAMGMSLVQSPHYASYILPAAAMLLGALLAVWGRRLAPRDRAVGSVVVLGLATVGVAVMMLATARTPQTSILFPIVDVLCAAAVIGLAIVMVRGPKKLHLGIVLALVVALLPLSSIGADTRHVFRGQARSSGSTYGVLLRAAEQIDEMVGARPVLFWFDRQGFNQMLAHRTPNVRVPDGEVYPLRHRENLYELNALDTLNAFYLWDRSRLNDQLPVLSPSEADTLRNLGRPTVLVVASYRSSDLDLARAKLAEANVPFTVAKRSVIKGRWFELHLDILDLANQGLPVS